MNRKLLNEWTPSFKAGEYDPGEAKLNSAEGEGVASKKVKQDKSATHNANSKMSKVGKEWPRNHNETAAMCDVDENGVENKPQGVHVSKPAKAEDGLTDKVAHNWPDKPKNSGGQLEKLDGTRYNDGGTLGEQWNPNGISNMMGEETIDLQTLFDNYANSTNAICVEDFQGICDAHCTGFVINADTMRDLMRSNQQITFYESSDANGPYWTSSSAINEDFEFGGEETEDEDENDDDMDDMDGMDDDGIDDDGIDDDGIDDDGMDDDGIDDDGMDDDGIDDDGIDDDGIDDDGIDDDGIDDFGSDEECYGDECDVNDDDVNDCTNGECAPSVEIKITYGAQVAPAMAKFENVARKLVKNGGNISEKLNAAWKSCVGKVNLDLLPSKYKPLLSEMKKHGLKIVSESDSKMDSSGQGDKALFNKGDGPKIKLPDMPSPDDIDEETSDNILNHSTNNDLSDKTFDGPSEAIKKNMKKLVEYVVNSLNSFKIPKNSKSYYTILVTEKVGKNRTKVRNSIAEAVADLEELLQYHNYNNVVLEAHYVRDGVEVLKRDVSAIPVSKRGLNVVEGVALFRFNKHANAVVNQLMKEGKSSRLLTHKWGVALQTIG